MWFMPNSELTSKSHSRNQDLFDHIFPVFCCTFWWYDMSYSLSLLFLADSAVVFSCCCGYLSYCCLPLNLKHSGLCALTCGNNDEFSSNDIPHSGYFQFFRSFYMNLWAWRNLKKLIASEILRPVASHSDLGTNSQVQSHLHFHPYSNA